MDKLYFLYLANIYNSHIGQCMHSTNIHILHNYRKKLKRMNERSVKKMNATPYVYK